MNPCSSNLHEAVRCDQGNHGLALAKRTNIVGQTSEIRLSNKLFDRLATSQNIADQTFSSCSKQKRLLKFSKNIAKQVLHVKWQNDQTLFVK